MVICCKSWFGSLKPDFILEVASNFIATIQRILNYNAFNGAVYNWFILMEEAFPPYFQISLLLELQINICSENQVGINSVKTKDYTYCNLTTTPEVF